MMDEPAFLRARRRQYRAAGERYEAARTRAMTDLLRAKLGLPAVEARQ